MCIIKLQRGVQVVHLELNLTWKLSLLPFASILAARRSVSVCRVLMENHWWTATHSSPCQILHSQFPAKNLSLHRWMWVILPFPFSNNPFDQLLHLKPTMRCKTNFQLSWAFSAQVKLEWHNTWVLITDALFMCVYVYCSTFWRLEKVQKLSVSVVSSDLMFLLQQAHSGTRLNHLLWSVGLFDDTETTEFL